jgi:uncharacterized protein (DUF983 family)
MNERYYPTLSPMKTGLACRCPRCGQGKLYGGFLKVAETCTACGLNLAEADSGDGPAVFLIFILGAIAVPLAFFLQFVVGLPDWLSMGILTLIVLGGALLLLRPAKAVIIALQYRNRAGEGRGSFGE